MSQSYYIPLKHLINRRACFMVRIQEALLKSDKIPLFYSRFGLRRSVSVRFQGGRNSFVMKMLAVGVNYITRVH